MTQGKRLALMAAVVLVPAAIGYYGGRRDRGASEAVTVAQARVDTVLELRAARVDTVRLAARKSAALHDTVRLVDTNRVEIPGPTVTSPPDTVEIPAVVVRRLVADSITIGAQARLIATDSAAIRALQLRIAATPARRWYDNRISIGPSLNAIVGRDGTMRAGVGVSVQLRIIGWP